MRFSVANGVRRRSTNAQAKQTAAISQLSRAAAARSILERSDQQGDRQGSRFGGWGPSSTPPGNFSRRCRVATRVEVIVGYSGHPECARQLRPTAVKTPRAYPPPPLVKALADHRCLHPRPDTAGHLTCRNCEPGRTRGVEEQICLSRCPAELR